MESNIDKIIEDRAAQYRAAREEAENNRREAIDRLLVSLKSHIGDFFAVLQEKKVEIKAEGDRNIVLKASVPVLDDYRLAPISIKWSGSINSYDSPFFVWGSSYREISDALLAARTHYQAYKADDRKGWIETFERHLHYGWNNSAETEEAARAVHAQYIRTIPDRKEEADKLLAEWIRERDSAIARKERSRREEEEEKARRALLETIRIGYVSELAEWMRKTEEIEAHNKKTAEEIQAVADWSTYTVYKISYAVAVRIEEDDEQDTILEIRSAYSLYGIPDSFGFWDLDGKKIKIYNPVTLEMLQVHASGGILAKSFNKAGVEIFFEPDTIDEKIPSICSDILDLPEEPKIPEELSTDYSSRMRYQRSARALITGESEDEIPF